MSYVIIGLKLLFIYVFTYLKAHTKLKTWSAKVQWTFALQVWVLWLLITLPYHFNYVNYNLYLVIFV